MSLNCGIVGLPNVGKSTLFNVFTKSFSAQAENYPFCTIDPNVGTVVVEDERLQKIAEIANSGKTIFNTVEIVDIAGLIKGAGQGEGLGNKFLSHIREVDAILHVVRCFNDKDIRHVHDKVDPLYDIEIIEYELMFADMESLDKSITSLEKKAKNCKLSAEDLSIFKDAKEILKSGTPIRKSKLFRELKLKHLLTYKPVLYVCNVGEEESATGNNFVKAVKEKYGENSLVYLSVRIEAEIASLETEEEKQEFMQEYQILCSGVNELAKAAYSILDLITFFTAGPKEARAWSVKSGSTSKKAAGVIHTDFEKNFIKAEVMSFEDYIKYFGESGCKAVGKLRTEGKDYILQDGDVIYFKVGCA